MCIIKLIEYVSSKLIFLPPTKKKKKVKMYQVILFDHFSAMCYASKGEFYRNMLFRVFSPRRCECDRVCLNVQGCAFDNTLVQSELLVLMKATVQPVFNMVPPPLMVLWFHTQFGSRFITAKINREGHPNTR